MSARPYPIAVCALILDLLTSTVSVAWADDSQAGPSAFMTASAWRDNGKTWLTSWHGPTRWNDELGVFRAKVSGGRLSWDGRDVDHVRVETDDQGLGGMPLRTWLSKKASDADLVVIVVSSHGHGSNPGGGTDNQAGDDDRRPRAPVVLTGTLEDSSRGGSRAAGSAGVSTGDADPEAADADTESLVHELTSGRGHGSGRGGRGEGERPGTGTEDGTPGGAHDGQQGGITAEQGGVADAYAARIDGQKFGDPEGGRGGTGSRGDAGARGGWAFFGGLIDVPRAIRAAVEVALILEDGNLLALGKDFFKSGVRQFADPVVARKSIAREARHHAAARMRVVHKELVGTREFTELAVEEQKRVLRVAMWEMQVQYFEGVARAAKSRRRAITSAMKKTRGDGEELLGLNAELAQVEQIAEAVQVKPVAGRLPKNHRYAGKRFPDARLDPEFRDKGVRFTKEGFPDFEPHAMRLPNGKKRVRIELTGDRQKDYAVANAKLGWKDKPEGYRWHHHENAGEMLLVPKRLHERVGHTGGAAVYKHVTGVIKYTAKGR